jgi:hypothetical protein
MKCMLSTWDGMGFVVSVSIAYVCADIDRKTRRFGRAVAESPYANRLHAGRADGVSESGSRIFSLLMFSVPQGWVLLELRSREGSEK